MDVVESSASEVMRKLREIKVKERIYFSGEIDSYQLKALLFNLTRKGKIFLFLVRISQPMFGSEINHKKGVGKFSRVAIGRGTK